MLCDYAPLPSGLLSAASRILLRTPFAAQGRVVYKWIDAEGVVHFSDQPVPGAEKVFTSQAPRPAAF